MIPLFDYNLRRANTKRPYVVWSIIIACAIVFIYQITLSPDNNAIFVAKYGMTPGIIAGWELPAGYPYPAIPYLLTLVTSLFLHGDFLHILFNMLYLWVFGDNIENAYGWLGFLVFYITGGVIANLSHMAFSLNPTNAFVPTIGASGAIAAVMGSYLALFPTSKIRTLVIFFFITFVDISAYWWLLIWFGMQFFNLLGGDGGVAWWAHIGGFIYGYIVGFAYLKLFRPYAPQPWEPVITQMKKQSRFFGRRPNQDDNEREDGRYDNQDIWRR